jgi:integrase
MALNDVKVRNAKPAQKQIKLSDTDGMYLLVTPAGGKCWRLKYRVAGKEKVLALGTYPEVSLSEARAKRDAARKQHSQGIDPGEVRKAQKLTRGIAAENSFEVIAREWHAKFEPTWADSHAYWVIRRLEQYVFPAIGSRPISELRAPDVLAVLRRIESVALETAHRVKFIFGQVFRYGVATGRAERDPSADLKGALPPRQQKHHPSIIDPKEVAGLLRAIDGYGGTYPVKCALQLSPLVFLRPGELRHAEWSEIDLEAGEWNIPIERMKGRKTIKEARKGEKHLVPLAKQAVTILTDLQALTGGSRYLFPSARSFARPMSNEAINAALERMGYKGEITGHGFRAMARTIIDEVLQIRPEFIEHQLGHAVRDALGRAYNRTTHLAERKKMMQEWADYLDTLKSGANIVS